MKTAQRATISYERKPGTIHSFFALKFHDGEEDRTKVEAIEAALNQAGVEITLMARDVEKWGKAEIPKGKTLMRDYAFPPCGNAIAILSSSAKKALASA